VGGVWTKHRESRREKGRRCHTDTAVAVREKKDSYDLWLQRKEQETSEKYKRMRGDAFFHHTTVS
jgi:hypothetical protein